MNRFFFICLAAVFGSACCKAQTPAPIGQIISYSGKLTNTDGTPVADGQKVLGIKLYANGTAVTGFAQTPTVFTVGGVFTTFLQYNGIIFDPAKKYELGVTPPGQSEVKMPLSSVPVAQVATTVPDGSIGEVKLATGAVTSSKWKPYFDVREKAGATPLMPPSFTPSDDPDIQATIQVDVPSYVIVDAVAGGYVQGGPPDNTALMFARLIAVDNQGVEQQISNTAEAIAGVTNSREMIRCLGHFLAEPGTSYNIKLQHRTYEHAPSNILSGLTNRKMTIMAFAR